MIQQPAGAPGGALLSKRACQAARSDGGACGAPPGPEGLCFWHDPAQHQEMVEAASKGGSRARYGRYLDLPMSQPLEASEARGVLASVLEAMLKGALDPNTAKTTAYILQVERKIAEGEALEERLSTLEELLHHNGRGM